MPLDEKNQNMAYNLAPVEREKFLKLRWAKASGKLNKLDSKELNQLQVKLRDGPPLNELHPGIVNLTPNQ